MEIIGYFSRSDQCQNLVYWRCFLWCVCEPNQTKTRLKGFHQTFKGVFLSRDERFSITFDCINLYFLNLYFVILVSSLFNRRPINLDWRHTLTYICLEEWFCCSLIFTILFLMNKLLDIKLFLYINACNILFEIIRMSSFIIKNKLFIKNIFFMKLKFFLNLFYLSNFGNF